MRDFREYPTNPALEPQDFTRIHDEDLANIIDWLFEAYAEFSHPNFTDRSEFAERAKATVEVCRKWRYGYLRTERE